jgi:hypothetical protein
MGSWIHETIYWKCIDVFWRKWLLIANVVFGITGIVIAIAGAGAITQTEQVQEEVVILEFFDLTLLAWAVMLTGLMTIAVASIGFMGALKYKVSYLKVYTFILFLVCCLELGVGIYLASLEVDVLSSFWFEETADGFGRRIAYQTYFDCCGWATVTDTYPYPGGGLGPECHNYAISLTCRQATEDWMGVYIAPIAVAVVIIPLFQIISLAGSCMILQFAGSQTVEEDHAFSY